MSPSYLTNTCLFFLQHRLPWAFGLLRRLWWRCRYGVAAPSPELGNCNDYGRYRQLIQPQLQGWQMDRCVSGIATFVLGQQSPQPAVLADADVAIFHPEHGRLCETASAHFRRIFDGDPKVVCVYCDHESLGARGPELVPFTVPNLPAWRSGAPLPACFALRLDALEDGDLSFIADQGGSWLVHYCERAPATAIRHLPLPLCRISAEMSELPLPASVRAPAIRGSLSIIIPTRNGGRILRACIDSLRPALAGLDCDLSVVDNGSTEPDTLNYLASLPNDDGLDIRVLRYDAEFNFSAINNWAVRQCRGESLLLLNDDVEALDDSWLGLMLEALQQPGVGVVGAQLRYPNGLIQHAGVALGLGGVAEHPGKGLCPSDPRLRRWNASLPRWVSAVTGACLLTHRSVYCAVGGLNETDLPIAFNDVDYCLKVRRTGSQVLYLPQACLTHHESISRGAEDSLDKHRRFSGEIAYMKRTWPDWIADDPFYSPHLSLHARDLSFRNPPSDRLMNSRPTPAATALT